MDHRPKYKSKNYKALRITFRNKSLQPWVRQSFLAVTTKTQVKYMQKKLLTKFNTDL